MGVGWGQMQGNRKIAISQRLSLSVTVTGDTIALRWSGAQVVRLHRNCL